MSYQHDTFDVVEQASGCGDMSLVVYQSRLSGIKLYLCRRDQPYCYGNFVFMTEIPNDYGIPHSLKHLIFLGCERTPYKGVLQVLANRSYATSTESECDQDHTSYSLKTVGIDGFLNLLPIYLEHLFFPTLSHEAFLTDIHHINRSGEDAGVIYNEVLNNGDGHESCMSEVNRLLFRGTPLEFKPKGRAEHIRTDLTSSLIRKFHTDYYIPSNFSMVITGPVTPQQIFSAIFPVEQLLFGRGITLNKVVRLPSKPLSPLGDTGIHYVQVPSMVDDQCLLYAGYRGPETNTNYRDCVAIEILLWYLVESSASPLQMEFVHCADPLCSSIEYEISHLKITKFVIKFGGVVRGGCEKLATRFDTLMRRYISDDNMNIDMDRLSRIIARKEHLSLLNLETNPHKLALEAALVHFKYGETDLSDLFDIRSILNELSEQSDDFWLHIMWLYFSGPGVKNVVVVGTPTSKLSGRLRLIDKERLAVQRSKLSSHLLDFGALLDRATTINNYPIPDHILKAFSLPSIENIRLFKISRHNVDSQDLPFKFTYDYVGTNFVTMRLTSDTSRDLRADDRLFLPLLQNLLFECPLEHRGVIMEHRDVVLGLYQDLVDYECEPGISSYHNMTHMFTVTLKCFGINYVRAVEWLSDILYASVFVIERIRTACNKVLADMSYLNKSPEVVCECAVEAIMYEPGCNLHTDNLLRQMPFFKYIIKQLDIDPEGVKRRLTEVRDKVFHPKNLHAHLTLNREEFGNASTIIAPWKSFLQYDYESYEKLTIADMKPCSNFLSREPKPKGLFVGVPSATSAYMTICVPIFTDINHPDLPALLKITKYLFQKEGPVWRLLRGRGLSYNFQTEILFDAGYIRFELGESSYLVEAYEAVRLLVLEYLNGRRQWLESTLISAEAALVSDYIKLEKTPFDRSTSSMIAYLSGRRPDFNLDLVERIKKVKMSQLTAVGNRYLRQLFEGNTRRYAVCCLPGHFTEISSSLRDLGIHLNESTKVDNTVVENLEL